MTIEEMKIAKRAIEKDIADILFQFEKQTGVKIVGISQEDTGIDCHMAYARTPQEAKTVINEGKRVTIKVEL